MGRTREKGKPVEELTLAELISERARCRMMIRISQPMVVKLVKQRLHAIERRMARDFPDEKLPKSMIEEPRTK